VALRGGVVTPHACVGADRPARSHPASRWRPWPSGPELAPAGSWRERVAKQRTVPVCAAAAADRAGCSAACFLLCAGGRGHALVGTTCVGGSGSPSYRTARVPDFEGLSEVR